MIWNDPKTGMSVFYSGPLNEENEPNGSGGVLKFLDGQIYEGEVFRGMRCGHGINSWPDGQQYCGEWSQNSRHGKGRHSWVVDGGGQKVVTGEWKKGRLHGRISFSWPDGSSFDGMCLSLSVMEAHELGLTFLLLIRHGCEWKATRAWRTPMVIWKGLYDPSYHFIPPRQHHSHRNHLFSIVIKGIQRKLRKWQGPWIWSIDIFRRHVQGAVEVRCERGLRHNVVEH